jgi:hypothetical protein
MIIGMDCMCSLGIYVNTDEKVVTWEGNSIPLRKRGELQDPILLQHLYASTLENSAVLLTYKFIIRYDNRYGLYV